jgi:hypothetical protein
MGAVLGSRHEDYFEPYYWGSLENTSSAPGASSVHVINLTGEPVNIYHRDGVYRRLEPEKEACRLEGTPVTREYEDWI